jgi:hypothetical protein
MKSTKCSDKVQEALESNYEDLKKLFLAYQEGDEDRHIEELGTFLEYGLAFDYVAPGTFKDQKQGYFRYQISCGGPGEEFRFYINVDFSCYSVEFWYLNWFDGSKVELTGSKKELLIEIYEFFRERGSVENEYEKEME